MGRFWQALVTAWRRVRPRPVLLRLADDGGLVGQWEVRPPPRVPGRYRYSAFRSACHGRLMRDLRAGLAVRCVYTLGGDEVRFTVTANPAVEVLEVTDFEVGPARG